MTRRNQEMIPMGDVLDEMLGLPKGTDWGFATEEEFNLAEHDAEIINKFAEELKSRLGDAIYPKDFESMRNLIDDVARDVNAR